MLGKYTKFWVALIGAVVALLTIYFGAQPWLPILINFLTAIGVYAATNTTGVGNSVVGDGK